MSRKRSAVETKLASSQAKATKFDKGKLRRLFLYIVSRNEGSSRLGSAQLNKVMWFSDAQAHLVLGRSITGETYVRSEHGPLSTHFDEVRDELVSEGLIRRWSDGEGANREEAFESLSKPEAGAFSPEEMSIIDHFHRYETDGRRAKGRDKQDYCWEIARLGENLPYSAILAQGVRKPTREELDWAKGVARRRSLP